jgi:beta-phosphoglucomutase family hydrolase
MAAALTPPTPTVRAAIFDMDGVVTDTAGIHAEAWRQMFNAVVPVLAGGKARPFDPADEYSRLVDGRSREDGVRAVLTERGLSLPEGRPSDPPTRRTVHGLANRKQKLFVELLARGGVRSFPSTVTLLRRLRDHGMPLALVTASRNSGSVLTAAGVFDLFDAVVDGNDAERLGLLGRPDPAMFLEAARRLAVSPATCVVVEDSVAGVTAARKGGFAVVVGVDRTGNRTRLLRAGAHVVVADLGSVDPTSLIGRATSVTVPSPPWRGGASAEFGPWVLTYHGFDPSQEGTREALCTLGNGYLGTRGAAPECRADPVHYPGTYIAGVYDRLASSINGAVVENEHLVNAPNWLPLRFAVGEEGWLTPDSTQVIEYRQDLDLRRALLTRVVRFRDETGRVTRVTSERLVSQHARHLVALKTTFLAENWSGLVRVQATLDGGVRNSGVPADAYLANDHLQTTRTEPVDHETVLLETITRQSRITIAMTARTRIYHDDQPVGLERRLHRGGSDEVGHEFSIAVAAGAPVAVEKVVAIATSRDRAVSTPALAVVGWVAASGTFAELLADHERAWADLWRQFGVTAQAGERARTALTLHGFHVLQVAATDPDIDAGLPARALSGEGYRGHVFWDEIFVHPLLTLRRPALTRAILLYRYRRLKQARAAAQAAGLDGALFPWQSGSDGRDETPGLLFNPRTKSWQPDNSRLQRHVGLAIAYSIIEYAEASGDETFLVDNGVDLIVDIVRCFASMAVYDSAANRYDIASVMGPDEFHDGYPGRPGSGVRNNAYTNILLAWTLRRSATLLERLNHNDNGRTYRRLRIRADELDHWDRLSRTLRVPFHPDGVISQFEGYEKLAEFDWDRYRTRYDDIGRLDLILTAEGDSPNNYRVAKQPDVLMLFYLLSAEELRDTLERLGYRLDKTAVRRTVDFYLARTSHGSTLSRPVCSWLLARADRTQSWSFFNQALDADLADQQHGMTREGIHLGAMAGTVDLLLRCYTGLETREGQLWFHPALPPELAQLRFQISYRNHSLLVELTPSTMLLESQPRSVPPIQVRVDDQKATLHPGHSYNFTLESSEHSSPDERQL